MVLLALIAVIATIVGFIGIIVKYFVSELKESRYDHKELTNKFIAITEENIESRTHLTESIDANTHATKKSTNSLSKLMLQVIKR